MSHDSNSKNTLFIPQEAIKNTPTEDQTNINMKASVYHWAGQL